VDGLFSELGFWNFVVREEPKDVKMRIMIETVVGGVRNSPHKVVVTSSDEAVKSMESMTRCGWIVVKVVREGDEDGS
jgi:hypothetical protein